MSDGLTPRQKQIVSAQGSLRERLLVLLTLRDTEKLSDLALLLETPKAELMAALGDLTSTELVTHRRREEEIGIHWYLTAKGRQLGGDLFDQTTRSLPALSPLEQAPAPEQAVELDAATERKPISNRRRVVMSEREPRGFSWE